MKISGITSYQSLQTTKNNQKKYQEISFSGKSSCAPKKLGLLAMGVISVLSGCARPALESDLAKIFRYKSPRLLKMFEKPKDGYELLDRFTLMAKEIGEVDSTSFENAIVKKTKELYGIDDKNNTLSYARREKRKVAEDSSTAPFMDISLSRGVSVGATTTNSDIYNIFDVTQIYEDVAPQVGQVLVNKGKDGVINFSSSDINLYGKLAKTTETFVGSKTETSSSTTLRIHLSDDDE